MVQHAKQCGPQPTRAWTPNEYINCSAGTKSSNTFHCAAGSSYALSGGARNPLTKALAK